MDGSQIIMSQSCAPSTFTHPSILGVQFTNLEANLVTNHSLDIPQGMYWSHQAQTVSSIKFCNVSLEYTHPGYHDSINTQVWLPIDDWNGRLQGSGGGGFMGGLVPAAMTGAVNQGYAVVSTNGGHVVHPYDVSSWALTSPGNLNWMLLQDFSSTTLNEAGVIGKAITKEFFGSPPTKSYWNGCSMGGRQGLHLAQRYPDAWDGILAAAPAIHGPKFVMAEFWPQMIMHEAGVYPPPCEFDAIKDAAIGACDELDGAKDGLVSSPELCTFDPKTLIGKEIECPQIGKKTKVSETAVKVAESVWEGARKPDGSFLWCGINHETPLTGEIGLANTICEDGKCKLQPFPIPETWIKYFVKRDPDFDATKVRLEELVQLFHQSHYELRSIISADDPDLSAFARAGGKMITWHGLADQVVMPNGSRSYYEAVTNLDSQVKDYYRYFEVPGALHCWGGVGPYPGTALEKLVDWVEKGKAPDTILGWSDPDEEGRVIERNSCAYPQRAVYKGTGNVRAPSSYECA